MNRKDKIVLYLGVFSFVFVALLVKSGISLSFDTAIYRMLHILPEAFAIPFFKGVTTLGDTGFVIVLVLFLTISLWKYKGVHILGISIVDICLNQSLKYLIARPRPSFPHLVHASGYSFPSGHTMIAITLYGMLFYLANTISQTWLKRLIQTLCLFIIVFVPMSRIYLGVHYATDIFGGYLVGGCALYGYIKWIKQKRG